MLHTGFWKKYFAVYDFLNLLEPYQSLLSVLVEQCGNINRKKILDAGAGTGNLAVVLVHKGAEVVCVDFSQEGLEIIRKKLPHVEAVLHDLTQTLPFPNNYFDVIVSNNALYTLPVEVRQKVLREFFRVLKSGGKIAISNVREGWKPVAIYLAHLYWSLEKRGMTKTTADIFRLIIPTIKIFYYNLLIVREHTSKNYAFMKPNEQAVLLREAGFVHISPDISTYAGQAIMNTAEKM